jgi:hypothetical protein
VLRVSRALPAVALVALVAGCGGSHTATPPTTTQQVNTVPKPTLELVVDNFPSELEGSVVYRVNSVQGNPKKPGGVKRNYTVMLDHLVLRLAGVRGKGDKRQARYNLVSAHQSFSGFEDLTSSKCKTTHIVWDGSGKAPVGAVQIYSPKFDAPVTFVFDVAQRGTTMTRPCRSSSGGVRNTVTRTARIDGDANLRLEATKNPAGRFSIGIEIQSSTAGPAQSGGYTINGTLVPPETGNPVKVCRQASGRPTCRT